MKENVLDVLMYLFETYIDAEEEPEPDQSWMDTPMPKVKFYKWVLAANVMKT